MHQGGSQGRDPRAAAGHQVGHRRARVEQRARGARAASWRKSSSQRRLLEALAERFGLATAPRRIEVFDNSHIQGANAVGAMIVAGRDGFVKGQYRKFNIKSENLAPGDDYGMMREVLTRRFKRLVIETNEEEKKEDGVVGAIKEAASNLVAMAAAAVGASPEDVDDDDVFPDRPDLVLIDGGAGQLAVAREVMADLGLARDLPDRRRQRARPRRGARALSSCRRRPSDDARAARPGALLRAAAARRGAPLRYRLAPHAPRHGDERQSARRHRRHRRRGGGAR